MSFGSTDRNTEKPKRLGNLDADRLNTNEEGKPVPVFSGRRLLPLQWIINSPYNVKTKKVKTDGGKAGDVDTGTYEYFWDIAGVLCMCGRRPLKKIYKIVIDKEVAWENSAGLAFGSAEYLDITIPNRGLVRIYKGSQTQPPDTLILAPRGVRPSDPGFDPRDEQTWPDADQRNLHPD